jgi:hypothetical protein
MLLYKYMAIIRGTEQFLLPLGWQDHRISFTIFGRGHNE